MLKKQLRSLVLFSSLLLSSCSSLFPSSSNTPSTSSSSESSSGSSITSSSSSSSSSSTSIRVYKTINRTNWPSLSTYPATETTVTIEDITYGYFAAGNDTTDVIQGKRNEFYFYNQTPLLSLISVSLSLSQSHNDHTIYVGNSPKPMSNPVPVFSTNNNTSFLYDVQGVGNFSYFNFVNGDLAIYINSINLVYGTFDGETSSSSSSSSMVYTYTGYYQALQGLEDDQLKPALTSTLRSILGSNNLLPSSITYGNSRYALADTDEDPANPNNMILVYRQTSVSSTWDGGATWNREHVFPQSKLGVETTNTSRHEGADYHNLKPANPSENSSRGNKYFDHTTTSTSYAPPNVVKGDIARILFYMVTMYPHLSLVDVTSGDPALHQMGQFSRLVQWHLEDPVDTFEARRNEVIYGYQGNRNPYIDHEELVCRVFKTQSVTATQLCSA